MRKSWLVDYRRLIRLLERIADAPPFFAGREAVPDDARSSKFCPLSRLGTRARGGVVRVKPPVYSK
jgi:hypothetical protein